MQDGTNPQDAATLECHRQTLAEMRADVGCASLTIASEQVNECTDKLRRIDACTFEIDRRIFRYADAGIDEMERGLLS